MYSYFLQHGANINVQNIDGKTPLHIAVEHQQSDVIVYLLSQDADAGLTDVWCNTPLHYLTRALFADSKVAESVEKLLTEVVLGIRNSVDVSVSMHVTAYGLSVNQCHELKKSSFHINIHSQIKECATETDNENVFCWNESDRDCNGNTPLHRAVGVYGQLKMFKVSTDVTETVEFLVKCGADINAQNKGLTPLHVARGEKAIEACLQHACDQSFTVTDKRGRNYWHLLFLMKTQNKSEFRRGIRPMIDNSDQCTSNAQYSVDNLRRTPLHYACMGRNPWISEWNAC